MTKGRLIVLEGIDGSGKSTQARRVAASLGATLTFEPGDTSLGAVLRGVVLDPGVSATALAEALVMAADRAQHVAECIEPHLAEGDDVVCDRFVGSTLAYQGFGGGADLEDLQRICDVAAHGVTADLTILLDCPVDAAVHRRGDRGRSDDRFERDDPGFMDRVRHGFLALASADATWVVIDASWPMDAVDAEVDRVLGARLR